MGTYFLGQPVYSMARFISAMICSLFQARQIKKCMTTHQECISYEVLRREAQDTMDPADPDYNIYDKKMKGETTRNTEEPVKKHKKERLIINPEFVESLSQGDASEQYDDYSNNEI